MDEIRRSVARTVAQTLVVPVPPQPLDCCLGGIAETTGARRFGVRVNDARWLLTISNEDVPVGR